MTKFPKLAIAAILIVCVSACAAGSEASHQAAHAGAVSQIVLGFWHGLIAPISLLVEVINNVAPKFLPWSMRFYETEGADAVYDVGFFIGFVAGPSILWSGTYRRRV